MVKVVTAIPSVMTAATLGPLLPRRVALPSPALLLLANGRSTHQIAERDIAEAALRHETAEPLRAAAMPSPSGAGERTFNAMPVSLTAMRI